MEALLLLALIASSLFAMALYAVSKVAKPTTLNGKKSNKQSTNNFIRASAKTSAASKESLNTISYVPFNEASASGAVVVDCTHPDAPTFTHHKSNRNPEGLAPADTSTGLVLNALASGSAFPDWLNRKAVTVNHFDGDALFSVWAFIHRNEALHYGDLLCCAAALHDFREMPSPLENGPKAALAKQALALCCWINTIECEQFSPPFEDSDADEKFSYFLGELGNFLTNKGENFKNIWQREYNQVLEDIKLIEEQGQVKKYPEIGVAIVRCPRPVHYYALFPQTLGCDVVVSEYIDSNNYNKNKSGADIGGVAGGGWHYEVEEKYTQFVNVWSRPVTARLNMTPLASLLNEIDTTREAECDWASPRMIDSGPLLRIDSHGQKLLKSQRYGHPTARPMYASGLSPEKFEEIVLSFFEFGLQGVEPRRGGFSWDELHQLNANKIDWEEWKMQIKASLNA